MEDVRHAGHQLRVMREERQLTQTELGRKAGISTQAVSRLELGTIAKPDMDTLVKIGTAFGMTPNEIAELYGYWVPIDPFSERGEQLRARILKMPEKQRESLLDWIEKLLELSTDKYGV